MLLKLLQISIALFSCQVLCAQPQMSDSTGIGNRFLDEVVVTGTYKATGIDKCVMPTRNLNIEKLQSLGVQTVADALKFQANLRIQQDNILGTGLSMQGISGENVKILVDGIPVIGRQNGNIDLSQLLLLNVERIEIVEGPLSVQYGTNALAGTINIITKKTPTKKFDVNANSYYESAGHINFGVGGGWRGDNQQLMLTAGRNFFSGWSAEDLGRFQQWKPKVQYFLDGNYGLTLGETKLNYKGNFFDEFILNRGVPLAPYGENAFDDHYKTLRYTHALNATRKITEGVNANLLVSYNYFQRIKNTYYRDLVNLTQVLTENAGDQDTSKFDLITARGTLSNTKRERFHYELGFDFNLESGSGQRILGKSQRIDDYAVFASTELKLTEGVTVRPGLRAAYNSAYNAPLIPSLHVRWKLDDQWTARASWAKGFRAPSLKELYFYFVDINHNIRGNENLRAEQSNNFNGIVNFKKVRGNNVYKFETSAFFNDIRNLITLALVDAATNEYGYINIGKFQTAGGQAYGELVFNHCTIGTGVAYTHRNNVIEGKNFGADTWEIRSNAAYNFPELGFDLNIWYKYSGRQPGFALTEEGAVLPTYISAYHMADAGFSKKMCKNKLVISAGVRNLFDVRNLQAQMQGGAHSGAAGSTALATGRNFFTKIEIRL